MNHDVTIIFHIVFPRKGTFTLTPGMCVCVCVCVCYYYIYIFFFFLGGGGGGPQIPQIRSISKYPKLSPKTKQVMFRNIYFKIHFIRIIYYIYLYVLYIIYILYIYIFCIFCILSTGPEREENPTSRASADASNHALGACLDWSGLRTAKVRLGPRIRGCCEGFPLRRVHTVFCGRSAVSSYQKSDFKGGYGKHRSQNETSWNRNGSQIA